MKKTALIAMSVLIAIALFGCSEKYGAGVDEKIQTMKVKDIFFDKSVVGKKVTLQGTVVSQCASDGCWFVLQDDTGQIFVNLGQNNITIPPSINKTAKVTGIVFPAQGELQIIAEGIEIR